MHTQTITTQHVMDRIKALATTDCLPCRIIQIDRLSYRKVRQTEEGGHGRVDDGGNGGDGEQPLMCVHWSQSTVVCCVTLPVSKQSQPQCHAD